MVYLPGMLPTALKEVENACFRVKMSLTPYNDKWSCEGATLLEISSWKEATLVEWS